MFKLGMIKCDSSKTCAETCVLVALAVVFGLFTFRSSMGFAHRRWFDPVKVIGEQFPVGTTPAQRDVALGHCSKNLGVAGTLPGSMVTCPEQQ